MENIKQTLVDKVCENIRIDIINQDLKPGDKIDIKSLSDKYGVSATPLKMALNRLVSENIIQNFPRQGMYIKTIKPEEINEIFEVRQMMDLYYARDIIKSVNYNATLRQKLIENVASHAKFMQGLSSDSGIDDFFHTYSFDAEFHQLYLLCSGYKTLLDLYHSVNPFLYTNYIFNKQSRKRDIETIEEHQRILDAILNEDEELLIEAIKNHYDNSKKTIELILKVYNIS